MAKTAPASRKRKVDPESDNDDESVQKSESDNEDSDNEDGSDEGSDNDDDDDDDNGDDEDGDDEDGDDDDEEEEEEDAPKGKKAKKAPAKKAAPKKAAKSKAKGKGKDDKPKKKKTKLATPAAFVGGKVPKAKTFKKSDRLEEARKAFKWWEAPELADDVNWLRLEHCGVNFPPPYVQHHIPLEYNGKPVKLTAEQEEVASFFAAMPLDGPQLGNPKTKPVFEKNFFEDFKETLPPGHEIRDFSKCNFDKIRSHLATQRDLKKAATDEEKAAKKVEKEELTLNHGYALIDGRIEKMGNFTMEPPCLFRGRGEHPRTGKLKCRCFAESVHINLSENSVVPICKTPGHAWLSVRHDPQVTWLASWNENVQNQTKYVMLAASSSFKGKSDRDKYGKAIKLLGCIETVRNFYLNKIRSKDVADRQLGTAMWIIDKLALRVGGEKGEDEADTVGCCSLRREHLTFNEEAGSFEIELEFLGKDSMLYKQNIDFAAHGDLGKLVYSRLKEFCDKKKPDQDVFETLTPPDLNKELNGLMKGLTAKVFRTFNASVTLQSELPTAESMRDMSVQDKVLLYNAANRQVAILCNHQKTVSKAAENMFETLQERLTTLRNQLADLEKWKKLIDKKKEDSIPLKSDDSDQVEAVTKALEKAAELKEKAKTDSEKLAAKAKDDEAKALKSSDAARRFLEKHMFKQTPGASSVEGRIETWKKSIEKLELDIRNRDENKEVALGTSKINYMDPRISVAWCKRCEVPIDKIFARTLRDKFNWAMAVPSDWKFK